MGSERKALFFDIDGTISDFDGTVSPLTVEALKLAKEKGHYLFVCTGRPKCHVDLSLLPGEYDGMISCAGALVEYQGKRIKDLVIPKKDLIRLDDILKKEGIYYLVQCADRVAYEEADEQKIREAMAARRMFSLPPELAEVLERGNMTVKSYRDMEDAEKIMYFGSKLSVDELAALLGPDFSIALSSMEPSGTTKGEIALSTMTKSLGMETMLQHIGVAREDSFAFGDSMNDMDMLEYAQVGVAMGNAADYVKASADYVTRSVAEGGIYEAMKHWGLI